MIPSDEYMTIESRSTSVFKDRGSKFIAIASPAGSADEAMELIEEIRKEYHDARHHCYAYMIGTGDDTWRVNDDGEPSGSAGNPIMGQIKSFNITNVVIVVVRYFGGTLLGVGGLINAYRTSAKEALSSAVIIRGLIREKYLVEFPYTSMNSVMKIIKEENIEQSNQKFELDCSLVISIRKSAAERTKGQFEALDGVKCSLIIENADS
ncbi:MAG: YigZ family protein [Bacteroidia bacterium]|nr:MAG: YigZ family protein [Bacteroidia bacterium]